MASEFHFNHITDICIYRRWCVFITIKRQGVVDKLILKFRDSPKRDSKYSAPPLFLAVTHMLNLSYVLGLKIL